MNKLRLSLGLMGASVLLFPACGGGGGSSTGGAGSAMDIEQVANGFGQLLPHTIRKVDAAGAPTQTIISIRKESDFVTNVVPGNPVLPTPQWPTNAILPNGADGNHFLYAEFRQELDIDSVLSALPGAQAQSGLIGSITLVAQDPNTGQSEPVPCRVLVNGYTYAGTPAGTPPLLELQHWVQLDTNGNPEALSVSGGTPGAGFPGVATNFQGAAKLISPRTICFIADTDNDLSTIEKFPTGRQIKLRISTAVRATNGNFLRNPGLAMSTVGADSTRPEVATTPPPINSPVITPGLGDTDIDPLTDIQIEFTEPIQPVSLGSINNGQPPLPSAAIGVTFGPSASLVNVPFWVMPVSVFDLSRYRLIPAFNFPGQSPVGVSNCGDFNNVTITVNGGTFQDLASLTNVLGGMTFFRTGDGPGLVNAPVNPDTIYLGRSGAVPGLSVVDLNGFGQSTGDPTFDSTYTSFPQGNSNFPNNPNVKLQGSTLIPPLQPGTCTFNGGSAGVFTLTLDSALNNLLVRAPLITSIGDMMLGHSLDTSFNNGPAPFGCQAGGGNLCAVDGNKVINPAVNGNTMQPALPGQVNGIIGTGAENLCCWAPHPNPPPLIFPPICVSPFINGQEPTSIGTPVANLLGPGNPFGAPLQGVPPSGLLTPEQNSYFQGPSLPATNPAACAPYMIRQQVGQYLYLIDRGRREIVVLNSNRMTVIDRIQTSDPTTLAMSPNLNLLAVVNQLGNTVSFIDIDPTSASFHQVIQTTAVGSSPRGIAWDPGNEDILVANELDGNVSVISALSLQVRKTVSSQLSQPFDIAITPRQVAWGFNRNVYFAYILNRNGRVAIYESGPNTVNGWGYDDVIGIATQTFRNPKAIQPDHVDLRSAVWIAHEGPLDLSNNQPGAFGTGAVSKLAIVSGLSGALPLNVQSLFTPQFRDMFLGVTVSTGTPTISGVPVDIAFDDMRSLSALPNYTTFFSAGAPQPINGKQLVRQLPNGAIANNNEPRYMFVAVPNPTSGTGVVDVLRIDSGTTRQDTDPYTAGTQSVPAPNVSVVMDYFRQ